jgi:hypothetical protein
MINHLKQYICRGCHQLMAGNEENGGPHTADCPYWQDRENKDWYLVPVDRWEQQQVGTPLRCAYHDASSALEHASHAWQRLIDTGRISPDYSNAWPPSSDATIPQSAEYYMANTMAYLNHAFDHIVAECEARGLPS